jgi:uncharacterized membrane protein
MSSAKRTLAVLPLLFIFPVACDDRAEPSSSGTMEARPNENETSAIDREKQAPAKEWKLATENGNTALRYEEQGQPALQLICPAGRREILVNVPHFRPVASEERMSFGSGGNVHTIVADFRGDKERGGVTGRGPIPENVETLMSGELSVNYGSQNTRPHPPPEHRLVKAFTAACSKAPSQPPPPAAPAISACLMQDGERLKVPVFRALGNEPFWNAAIEGRCVTYSHPDNIAGKRIWSRYAPNPSGGGRWSGALDGRKFELTIRPKEKCSDGMSDRAYDFSAELLVDGGRRNGCAEIR